MSAEEDPPTEEVDASARARGLLQAGVLLVHFALLVLMMTRALDPLFNDAQHRLGPGTDLAAYRAAGRAWLAGGGVYGHGPGFGFRYHPIFAITVGAALSQMSDAVARGAWTLVNEAWLGVDLWILRRMIPDDRRFGALAAVLLLSSPYLLEVYMGNASFVCASLLLLAFHLLERGRRAAWLGLFTVSVLVKPLGLVFVPVLLMRRRFADVAIVSAVVGATAAPYFFAHPGDVARVLAVNLDPIAMPGWVVHAGNQGLVGLATDVLVRASGLSTETLSSLDGLGTGARVALAAIPLALFAVTLAASWRGRAELALGLFLWSAFYLLAYKDVWEHSYSFLVLGLGYLWKADVVPRRLLLACAIALAAPTAFVLYDVDLPPGPIDPEHHWGFGTALLHHATRPLELLVLYGAGVRAAFRARP